MQKSALMLFLAIMAVQALIAQGPEPHRSRKRVRVAQLEQILTEARSNAEVVQQLSGLKLMERLSADKFDRWEAHLPDLKSRRALLALADESAFLDLPPSEIPATDPPDIATQRRIIALAVKYITKTIFQLPNLYASRVITRFEDEPRRPDEARTAPHSLKFAHGGSDTVLYSEGREVHSGSPQSEPEVRGLLASARLGSIMGTTMADVAQGTFTWGHWEEGATGQEAVFSFAVPAEKSHYAVAYCCVYKYDGKTLTDFTEFPGYHGQIAVDPSNGAILRLVLFAEPKPRAPFVEAEVAVEYAPVKIGSNVYICPARIVTLSRGLPFRWRPTNDQGWQQTMLNDFAFEKYHLLPVSPPVPSLPPHGDGNVGMGTGASQAAPQ